MLRGALQLPDPSARPDRDAAGGYRLCQPVQRVPRVYLMGAGDRLPGATLEAGEGDCVPAEPVHEFGLPVGIGPHYGRVVGLATGAAEVVVQQVGSVGNAGSVLLRRARQSDQSGADAAVAAQCRLPFQQQHPRPGLRRLERGREPGQSGADHGHIPHGVCRRAQALTRRAAASAPARRPNTRPFNTEVAPV